MKNYARVSVVVFIWYYSLSIIFFLIDRYFVTGGDPSTLGSTYVVLFAQLVAGAIYSIFFSGLIISITSTSPLPKKFIAARILGASTSLYGFVDQLVMFYWKLNPTTLSSLIWVLVVPLLLAAAFLRLARGKLL